MAQRSGAGAPQGDSMNFLCRQVLLSGAVVACFLFALGCGSGRSNSNPAQLRVMDASPQQQTINFLVDHAVVQAGVVSQSGTAYTAEPSGNHALSVEAFGTTNTLVSQNVSLTAGAYYSFVVAPPSFGSTQLAATLFTDDNSAPASGNFKLRIINEAPNFGNLDAYVTAPGAGISGATPNVSNLAFQSASSYVSLPAGNYEVYFSVAGQQVISVDAGQFTFTSGQIRTIVLADNFGTGYIADLLADLN